MKQITKLQAVQKIVGSNGRYIGLSYTDRYGKEISINARFPQPLQARWNQDKVNGVVTVLNVRTRKRVRVASTNMISIRVDKKTFTIK